MKKFKKIFAAIAAGALVVAMSFTSMAAATKPEISYTTFADQGHGNASITVKLPVLPEGSTAENVYEVYRVFDASHNGDENSKNISYKLNANHTPDEELPSGFSKDNAGNITYGSGHETQLSSEAIEGIKHYIDYSKDLVATIRTKTEHKSFTLDKLPYGYYYISTTTGTLVTVDSTTPKVEVQDKNILPTLDKKITGVGIGDYTEPTDEAIAQLGTTVTFTSTIKVGKGVGYYEFHDNMDDTLELKENSVQVTGINEYYYNIYTKLSTPDDTTDTLMVAFDNTAIASKEQNSTITISYQAVVKSGNLTADNPAKNTAYLSYGVNDKNEEENEADARTSAPQLNLTNRTGDKVTRVYNARIVVNKFEKSETDKEIALPGAGFVLMNNENKYYMLNGENVEWVNEIAKAKEFMSDETGKVGPFEGLANGTYTLIEKTVPASYNKADDQKIKIDTKTYTSQNLDRLVDVENRKGIKLPSTGGMGTVAFAVVGLIVMAGAAVTLIIKKRA